MRPTDDKQKLERGAAILSNAQNFRTLYEQSVASLQQSSKSKAGIEGVTKPKLTEGEREKRQAQDSENRRVLRETKRAATTGRVSNWLKRYAERKETEYNTQNASSQQMVTPSASISYIKGAENPDIILATRQNSNSACFKRQSSSIGNVSMYSSQSAAAMSTNSQLTEL